MSYKHIVTLAVGEPFDRQSLSFAAWLALEHDARVTVVPAYPDAAASIAAFGVSAGGAFPQEVYEALSRAMEETQSQIETTCRDVCKEADLTFGPGDGAPRLVLADYDRPPTFALARHLALADLVVVGQGLLNGADRICPTRCIAAFDIRHVVGDRARVVMVSRGDVFHFTPSNPWVAVRWRTREAIEVRLPDVMRRKGVEFINSPVTRIRPSEKGIDLADGRALHYDYLVIATGPELAFDEIPGLGPEGHTVSICHVDHAVEAAAAFDAFMESPGPIVVGAVQGASCFGPAYEFAMILDTELRRRKLRDRAPMTFVTSEPYIGHLGLDGVGDTKGLLESEMRQRHIKWITNARVKSVDAGMMHVEEVAQDGSVKTTHDLPFAYSMMLPAFRGVEAVRGVEGLTNPRGFVLVDKHQRNPTWPDIFALGVCIAIPPTGPTPVPVGVPKTGFMIESMVTATAANLRDIIDGKPPTAEATWNAICLADFGDEGLAFIAQPQIPPRNINWASRGRWVHAAKAAFERYFLHKVRTGQAEPLYEKLALNLLGARKLRIPVAPDLQETRP